MWLIPRRHTPRGIRKIGQNRAKLRDGANGKGLVSLYADKCQGLRVPSTGFLGGVYDLQN